MLPSALRGGPGELLHFRLQLILLRLEEVLDDGGDQVIQVLPQVRHVAVQGPKSSLARTLHRQIDRPSHRPTWYPERRTAQCSI